MAKTGPGPSGRELAAVRGSIARGVVRIGRRPVRPRRPSYPPALIDALLADGERTVLDVGCGTGIASALFAARGCAVTGVEVDSRMAEIARAKGLEVEVSTFERWDDCGRRFDVVASGQAWHWIDPTAGATRAADVLRRQVDGSGRSGTSATRRRSCASGSRRSTTGWRPNS